MRSVAWLDGNDGTGGSSQRGCGGSPPIVDTASTQMQMSKEKLRVLYGIRLAERPSDGSDEAACFARSLTSLVGNLLGDGGLVAFCPFRKEPDIRPFLQNLLMQGRALYLPRYRRESSAYELVRIRSLENDLTPGYYGIQEPVKSLIGAQPPFHAPMQQVWLVPGIAFDRSGNRLGRGKGFYDMLLEGADGVKIGVAYDCQIADAIPSELHDVSMDYVVTESQIIDTGRR